MLLAQYPPSLDEKIEALAQVTETDPEYQLFRFPDTQFPADALLVRRGVIDELLGPLRADRQMTGERRFHCAQNFVAAERSREHHASGMTQCHPGAGG
jgi:hypothetical protein